MEPTLPLRNILAATDFRGLARRAAERAAQLAGAHGARLTLLHSMGGSALDELRRWLGTGSEAEQGLRSDAESRLRELAAQLGQDGGAAAVETRLGHGSVVADIAQAAEQAAADLVVLGRAGLPFWHRAALGSTAERVLRRVGRPVLAVSQLAHAPYRRVLVPLDFSGFSEAALAFARRVAPQAHVVLLHAWETPYEGQLAGVRTEVLAHYGEQARHGARAAMERLAAAHGLGPGQWTPRVVHGAAAFAIVEQEQELDCELIAVGKQGRSRTDELLLGSVTRHVLAEAQADVLVVGEPGPA